MFSSCRQAWMNQASERNLSFSRADTSAPRRFAVIGIPQSEQTGSSPDALPMRAAALVQDCVCIKETPLKSGVSLALCGRSRPLLFPLLQDVFRRRHTQGFLEAVLHQKRSRRRVEHGAEQPKAGAGADACAFCDLLDGQNAAKIPLDDEIILSFPGNPGKKLYEKASYMI